ncbi:MAG: cytochrome b/b6 domain-containing protein [Sphingobacteriales bacterium]|nr:MAG: cytochrome b/b6 domain-containing protein [Sphingobacteriales bacterium]
MCMEISLLLFNLCALDSPVPALPYILFNFKTTNMNGVSFREQHSRAIRFWHWATVFVLSFILLTAFTAKFFTNPYQNHPIIFDALVKQGLKPSGEGVHQVTNVLTVKVWKVHTYFGYILAGLLAFRFLAEIFQPVNQRIAVRIGNAVRLLQAKKEVKSSRHYLIVKLIYLIAYTLLAVICFTGVWMGLHSEQLFNETANYHQMKEYHETAVNLLLIFMLIHLVGVIRAERGKYKNVVSDMINGGKENE